MADNEKYICTFCAGSPLFEGKAALLEHIRKVHQETMEGMFMDKYTPLFSRVVELWEQERG